MVGQQEAGHGMDAGALKKNWLIDHRHGRNSALR
jgi:hypothetical protein